MTQRNGVLLRGGPAFVLEDTDTYDTYTTALRRYREELVTKWGWLLEGTRKQKLPKIEEWLYEPMAMLFENQQAQCRGIIEATTLSDVTLPERFALPLIRKIFPELFALKIASIQPLPLSSGGVGQIFFQDMVREDAGNTSLTVGDSDYAVGAENSIPKRVKMTIVSESITTVKDILAATWSTDVAEDARGTLGLDVEAEVITNAANEIIREIDERILKSILDEATAGDTDWYWKVPVDSVTGAQYMSSKDHYETFGHAMIDAEDLVYGGRFRQCDYIVGGRSVIKFIRKMQDFKPEPRNQPVRGRTFAMGVELVGRIEGFWDVYLTHYSWMNYRAIMGVYPRSQTDAGYIWCPYIPLTPMPLVYAEFKPYDDATMPGAFINSDKWTRNIRTRHGRRMVVPEYFATLTIAEEA